MAANKYLSNVGGALTEVAASQSSAANAIAAMDATGRLASNMMPVGIGAETTSVIASETLTAGDFVNIHINANVCNMRKADGNTTGKEANGFVIAGVTSGLPGDMYALGGGPNNQLSGMTIGAKQYLSDTTPGSVTESVPVGAGKTLQLLGRAESATEMVPYFTNPITLA